MHDAAAHGRADIVDGLIKRSVRIHLPDATGRTPVYYAADRGHDEVVARLVDGLIGESGASPAGWTNVICELAEQECTKELQRLLDAGGDANSVGSDGWSALHWAVWRGSSWTVAVLLDYGANANLTAGASEGALPLHLAAVRGDPDIVQRLIEHGAAIDGRDSRGMTPLSFAVLHGKRSTPARLIEKGSDVNQMVHRYGIEQSALMMAVAGPRRDWDMVELLVRAGSALYLDIHGKRHFHVDILRDAGEPAAAEELSRRIRKAGKSRPEGQQGGMGAP